MPVSVLIIFSCCEPGAENLAQLQCGLWLVAFPSQVDHDVPLPILTLNFVMDFTDDFVVDDPLTVGFFLKVNLL